MLTDLEFDTQYALVCPTCGEDSLDRYEDTGPKYYPIASPDENAVTVHPDRDEYEGNPLGTRGGWVQIDLFCPCSPEDVLTLSVANHKGTERLMFSRVRSANQP